MDLNRNIKQSPIIGLAGAGGGTSSYILYGTSGGGSAYEISKSLRFNDNDSAYLGRTPGVAGNRRTFTFSCWLKRSNLSNGSAHPRLLATARSYGTYSEFNFMTDDTLRLQLAEGSFLTNQVFRDPCSWYHIVLAVDTTQGSNSDRVKIYVNGTQIPESDYSSFPSITINHETGFNAAQAHAIGRYEHSPSEYLDGYLADVYLIDGQAKAPTDFGEFDDSGVWQPKLYTGGNYGTCGFHLNFSDNSNTTATTLGKDTSGQGNNWTPNNFSVAAGADNDSLTDTPTNFGTGTDTGAGGEIRGNYATINVLQKSSAFSLGEGNLEIQSSGGTRGAALGTIAYPRTGKWYYEIKFDSVPGYNHVGVAREDTTLEGDPGYNTTTQFTYWQNGSKTNNVSYGDTYTASDVIGVCFDADNGRLVFYKNDDCQGVNATGLFHDMFYFFPYFPTYTFVGDVNFGQRPFAYNIKDVTAAPTLSNGALIVKSKTGTFSGKMKSSGGNLNFWESSDGVTWTHMGSGTSYSFSNKGWVAAGGSGTSFRTVSTTQTGVDLEFAVYNGGTEFDNNSGSATDVSSLTRTDFTPYKSLNTANLPAATVPDGSIYFQARTRDGGGTTQSFTTLRPGWVWQKNRTDNGNHYIYDVLRGNDKYIDSQSTAVENSGVGALTFNANSYDVAGSFDWPSGKDIIDWVWDAGASTVNRTVGSLDTAAYDTSQNFSGNTSNPVGAYGNASNAFDGSLSSHASPSYGNEMTYTNPSPGSYVIDTLEIYAQIYSTAGTGQLNGNDIMPQLATGTRKWWTISGFKGQQFSTFKWGPNSGNLEFQLGAIRINGKMLVDTGTSVTNVPSLATDVRANPDAGFSISKWSGASSSAQIAHGLSKPPEVYLLKDLNNTHNWVWVTTLLPSNPIEYIYFNDYNSTASNFGTAAPDYQSFVPGQSSNSNYISYNFHSVEGYSRMGYYIAEGGSQFVYCGFRPAVIIAKNSQNANSWWISDTKRGPTNVIDNLLFPSDDLSEYTDATYKHDILSNGFRVRGTWDGIAKDGQKIVFMAFAEHPFNSSRAR